MHLRLFLRLSQLQSPVHSGLHPSAASMHVLDAQAAAAATQQSVSLFYASPSMQAAAYVSDWDSWRANGVRSLVAQLDLRRRSLKTCCAQQSLRPARFVMT